jgi:outer membrane protein insertion porin family
LIYDVTEGDRYRVGQINVKISGDNPYTRRTVALNRLSIRPGDVVDIRKVRDSERRLRASGLFLSDPVRGVRPKIVFRELTGEESIAERDGEGQVHRGQSPDGRSDSTESLEISVYPENRQSSTDSLRRSRP